MELQGKKEKTEYHLLRPHGGYFNVAFVFGPRAYDRIMDSDIKESIKEDLRQARVYTEGRGVKMDVKCNDILNDIERLVQIKLYF